MYVLGSISLHGNLVASDKQPKYEAAQQYIHTTTYKKKVLGEDAHTSTVTAARESGWALRKYVDPVHTCAYPNVLGHI